MHSALKAEVRLQIEARKAFQCQCYPPSIYKIIFPLSELLQLFSKVNSSPELSISALAKYAKLFPVALVLFVSCKARHSAMAAGTAFEGHSPSSTSADFPDTAVILTVRCGHVSARWYLLSYS